jgi:hypothetical protein
MNHNWIPDLTRPKNEILIILNWVAAALAVLIPAVTAADLTTPQGVTIFVFLAAGLIGRRNATGPETAQQIARQIADNPFGE